MPRLHRYQAKQVSINRRRHYQIEGHHYPGVTTILSATKPYEDRKRLWDWQARVGKSEAQQITSKAASAGTKLHKLIGQHLNQEAITIPDAIAGYWHSIAPILETVQEPWLVEGAVWHPDGFAGFPDALIQVNDQLYVCDWKTARKPKRREWITDYCLQVAAYTQAINWVYPDVGVNQALIAIALDGSDAQTFELSATDLEDYWQQFQQRLQQFYDRR